MNSKKKNKKRLEMTHVRAQGQDERKKRLAEALRENLLKRKSQQRKLAESDNSDIAD